MFVGMLVGMLRLASREPLGGSYDASWVPLLGLLGASWGSLGASRGLLKAEGWICQCLVSRWGPFGARLGGLLGRLGWLLGRLGALLGRLGTVLEASWAVLGRS